MKRAVLPCTAIAVAALLAIGAGLPGTRPRPVADPPSVPAATDASVRRPQAVAWMDDRTLAVTDRRGDVALIRDGAVAWIRPIGGEPSHVVADAGGIWVTDRIGDRLVHLDGSGQVVAATRLPGRPQGLTRSLGRLLVCQSAFASLAEVDPATGSITRRLPVASWPVEVATHGRRAVVAHALPMGDARRPDYGATVSVVDLDRPDGAAVTVALPPGSTHVRGIALSGDGRWAYAVHDLGHIGLPTTHPDMGWIGAHAVSIIDVERQVRRATVLLDQPAAGAADPWSVVVAGNDLWVSASGVHALIRIDLGALHGALAGEMPRLSAQTDPTTWAAVVASPAGADLLTRDTAALTVAGMIERRPLSIRGPRGLAERAGRLAVAGTYSGTVAIIDRERTATVRLGAAGMDPTDVGEALFHDASRAWQGWSSCATCHPDDARVDGLNWDLLNDGVGNPKNVRSLLLAPQRAPVMSLGVRADARTAVRAGFRFIAFTEPSTTEIDAVLAYLGRLRPEPSPFLETDGRPSAAAQRGAALFAGRAGCNDCHAGPHRSDGRAHDVGTVTNPIDAGKPVFTPMLVELWRTAPYLHDGSAPTLRDVLTTANAAGRHGDTQGLSAADLDDLVAYLASL
jgi:hypothetical protein